VSNDSVGNRWSASSVAGLALILAGLVVFLCVVYWKLTYTPYPLNAAISLSPGHVRTPEFEITFSGGYDMQILADCSVTDPDRPSLKGFDCTASIGAVWTLRGGARAFSAGRFESSRPAYGRTGDVPSGRYYMELEVLEDGSSLNAGSPRLALFAAGYLQEEYEDTLFRYLALVILLGATGVSTLCASLGVSRWEKERARLPVESLTSVGPPERAFSFWTDEAPRSAPSPWLAIASSESVPPLLRAQRTSYPSAAALRRQLCLVSLFGVGVYSFLILPMWVMQFWRYVEPHGLLIHAQYPSRMPSESAGLQPIRIRVELSEQPRRPLVRMGPHTMSLNEFGPQLLWELRIRPSSWPVYVDGDPDLEWGEVVSVIDVIRGCHGEVVMLPLDEPDTAKSRASKRPSRGKSSLPQAR